jgi:hypothetical protein
MPKGGRDKDGGGGTVVVYTAVLIDSRDNIYPFFEKNGIFIRPMASSVW